MTTARVIRGHALVSVELPRANPDRAIDDLHAQPKPAWDERRRSRRVAGFPPREGPPVDLPTHGRQKSFRAKVLALSALDVRAHNPTQGESP